MELQTVGIECCQRIQQDRLHIMGEEVADGVESGQVLDVALWEVKCEGKV